MNLSRRHPSRCHGRGGFTLTELLVATALTVIIMLMFARMYSSAVGSIKQQRSLSRNDQSARTLSATVRGDLRIASLRQPGPAYGNVRGIVPLTSGDQSLVDPHNQLGYIYISENDSLRSDEDVLAFTVILNNSPRGDTFQKNQQRPFVGKAGDLGVPNEPERDDGVDGDGLGSSRAAEIVYFMRAGNLYRRVLLLRDPLSRAPRLPDQPSSAAGVPVFAPGTQQFSAGDSRSSISNEFDYAVYPRRLPELTAGDKNLVLTFHTLDSLANDRRAENAPLGLPHFRHGFDNLGANPLSGFMGNGRPREYDSDGRFFGRLTLDELTKVVDDTPSGISPEPFQDPANDYPAVAFPGQFLSGGFPNTANPYSTTTILQDSDQDGSLDVFGALPTGVVGALISDRGARVGEDILLPHVEAFDIEVWDPDFDSNGDSLIGPGGFVNLGYATTNPFGQYSNASRIAGTYDSGGGFRNIYDTWHPSANSATDLDTAGGGYSQLGMPPYRPVITPVSSLLSWSASSPFTTTNNIVIRDRLTGAARFNGEIIYHCVAVGAVTGLTGTIQPDFPPVPGTIVQDGDITWQCVDNRIGLRAIRITVRYRDNGVGTPRQVSIVHSFVE